MHKDDIIMFTADVIWILWCVVGLFTGVNITFGLITLFVCLLGDYIRYRKYLPNEYQIEFLPGVV